MVVFLRNRADCAAHAVRQLSGNVPLFFARIGGSDTAAVVDYMRVRPKRDEALRDHLSKYLPLVSSHNGFYDLDNPEKSYHKYIALIHQSYKNIKICSLCNYQLLSIFYPDVIGPDFYREEFLNKNEYERLVTTISLNSESLVCYPYDFIERLVSDPWSMFRVFSQVLVGKRVLVVSPFADSITAAFPNRRLFFKNNYDYPEFELILLNTPITYSGLPENFYPDRNWFDTLARLEREVAKIDFDIALLSCGSYAVPLGDSIKANGRKAVYVGGILQLFFGVMGRRYKNPFFTDQLNLEYFISPVERERYQCVMRVDPTTANEAFGAYF